MSRVFGLILLMGLHMEMVQYAVEDRSQYEAGRDDKQETREDRVGSGKDLSSRGLQLTHWSHAGQNHRRIDVRICKRHALECGIASHSDRQTDRGKYEPQSNRLYHAVGETTARDDPLVTTFETRDSRNLHISTVLQPTVRSERGSPVCRHERDAAAGTLFASALRPHVRGRAAETTAERAVEMGEVGESGIESDGADGAADTTWVRKHLVRAHEPLRQNEFRERCGLGRKQHVDVARGDAKMRRHGGGREIMAAELLHDEGLGRAQ